MGKPVQLFVNPCRWLGVLFGGSWRLPEAGFAANLRQFGPNLEAPLQGVRHNSLSPVDATGRRNSISLWLPHDKGSPADKPSLTGRPRLCYHPGSAARRGKGPAFSSMPWKNLAPHHFNWISPGVCPSSPGTRFLATVQSLRRSPIGNLGTSHDVRFERLQ